MGEYYEHPIFGRLTDEEDIKVFKRQEEEAEYQRQMDMYAEQYYREQMEEMNYEQYFGDDFNNVVNEIRIMTMEKKTLKYALNALKEIEAEIMDDTIKDKEFPTLVNMKTMEDIGFAIILYLNGKYEYSDKLLDEWKEKLCADEYIITLKNKQLQVKFTVRYETCK